MPNVLKLLMIIGTAAMLWVGGNIIVHSLAQMGFHGLEDAIKGVAKAGAAGFEGASGFVTWAITAFLDGIFGVMLGFGLIPLVNNVFVPLWSRVFSKA